MRLMDWHALWLTRRGYRVHLRTDPACIIYLPPRDGSLLDKVSRGRSCSRCMRTSDPYRTPDQPIRAEETTEC